jgi:ferredoxin
MTAPTRAAVQPPERPTEKALSVDWTACDGRGLCLDLLPELLEADPWGFPRPRPTSAAAPGPGALAMVPEALTGPAARAVHLCPKLALRLSEPRPGERA